LSDDQKAVFAAGCGLLWRRQSVLWWLFVVNLVCGALGAAPAAMHLHHALAHSLAGAKLSNGFDLGMFFELVRLPSVNLLSFAAGSYIFAFVFFVFMLFVTGGILETYRQDRHLATSDFFAASGAFFWPFVRLMLLSIVPFAIVSMIHQALSKLADHIGDRAIADQVGIFLSLAALIVFLLLALLVRLWFDVAQVRAVAQNQRCMWRNLWKSWRITSNQRGRLFWIYLRIAVVAWITLAVGLVIWARLPAATVPLTFFVLELIVFAQLATRLWQLASAMTWYQGHAEMVPAPAEYTPPPPQIIVEAPPSSDLAPEGPAPQSPATEG
jgi:hypothetical protein